jgi:Na+/H+ antiporter NhaD/arsenite permease-like protein
MLLTRRIKYQKIYQEIDWTPLLMFIGLFIVVTGLEKTVLTPRLVASIAQLHLESAPVLSAITPARGIVIYRGS